MRQRDRDGALRAGEPWLVRRGGGFAAWASTRCLLAMALTLHYPLRVALLGDVAHYRDWARVLAHGHLPVHDPTWQYPPGAALIFLTPRWITGLGPSYHAAFVGEMLVVDFVVWLILRRRGPVSSCIWVVGGLLLGPVTLGRFDLVPTALSVAALCMPDGRGDRRFGLLIGLGALVKVWPLALLTTQTRRRLAGALLTTAATIATAALLLAAAGQLGPSSDFLQEQRSRGLEVEAVAALPWQIARSVTGHHRLHALTYGALEVHGAGVQLAATICSICSAVVLVVAGWSALQRRATGNPAAIALVVLLLLMLFARVLSPQYLIWPLGVAAVGATTPEGRRAAWWVVAACAVTQLEYPILFDQVTHAHPTGIALLLARDALLIIALAAAVRAVRAGGRALRVNPEEDVVVSESRPARECFTVRTRLRHGTPWGWARRLVISIMSEDRPITTPREVVVVRKRTAKVVARYKYGIHDAAAAAQQAERLRALLETHTEQQMLAELRSDTRS